jgi:hypothetical protein
MELETHVGSGRRGGDWYCVQVCCSDDGGSAAELLARYYCGAGAEADVGGDLEVVGHWLAG